MKCSLGISNFLEESILSLVFPILLFSSVSLHCSVRKTFLSLLAQDSPLSIAASLGVAALWCHHFVEGIFLCFFPLGHLFLLSADDSVSNWITGT